MCCSSKGRTPWQLPDVRASALRASALGAVHNTLRHCPAEGLSLGNKLCLRAKPMAALCRLLLLMAVAMAGWMTGANAGRCLGTRCKILQFAGAAYAS